MLTDTKLAVFYPYFKEIVSLLPKALKPIQGPTYTDEAVTPMWTLHCSTKETAFSQELLLTVDPTSVFAQEAVRCTEEPRLCVTLQTANTIKWQSWPIVKDK